MHARNSDMNPIGNIVFCLVCHLFCVFYSCPWENANYTCVVYSFFDRTPATNTHIVFAICITGGSAKTVGNPSFTQGFNTGADWKSRPDQNWAIKTGLTPDADGHYLGTNTGTSTWTYFVTKDANKPQITQEQRQTFTTKLIANFATTSSAVTARLIVYLNASSANDRGWYASSKIEGRWNLKNIFAQIFLQITMCFLFLVFGQLIVMSVRRIQILSSMIRSNRGLRENRVWSCHSMVKRRGVFSFWQLV